MEFKKFYPHLLAIAVFLFVAAIFYAPNAFSGKVLPQPDNEKARGMQTEVRHYMETEGKAPLWTNAAFGGMPSFQVYSPVKSNLTAPIYKTLFLWADYTAAWVQVFVAMFCLYFLLSVLGLDWRAGIVGAVAFGITTYNVDILVAGHSTKMAALALSSGILAGVVLTFQGRLLLGGGLTALFTAMQLYANHVQITYYTLLLAGLYILAELANMILRRNGYLVWGRAVAVVGLAFMLGFGANLSRLWTTYEYGSETIRGKSDLSQKAGKGNGLDKKYIFDWSSGIGESLTLMVPHARGCGFNESIRHTGLFETLTDGGGTEKERQQIGQTLAGWYYWGDQPFVGTAIYFGAIVCFLFFLGAWLVTGPVKWWLVSGGLFSIMIAWGKNFFLNEYLVDIIPMMNKFRAVTMALGIAQLCFAALAAMGLQYLFDQDIAKEKKKQALYVALGLSAFFCLLPVFMGGGENTQQDQELAAQYKIPNLLSSLIEDRAALARSDAFRSLGFIALAAGLIWLGLAGRLKAGLTVLLVGALALTDHWMVSLRNISPEKYEAKRTATAPPAEKPFDKQIKSDKDPHYRVLDLSRGGITGNAYTSYFHKSLSGYHAAKLQRFQEVVDTFLGQDLGRNLHIVGMMNGKYVVIPKDKDQVSVLPNEEACGNAWFVGHALVAPTAEAELAALRTLNPKDTAVLQENLASNVAGLSFRRDSTDYIRLSSYHPDKMVYEYSARSEQLAVFSEIYYPPAKGWKCYLNGQAAPDFFKVNYLLRGMRLPAGEKMSLEMRFEPRSYYLGEQIALGASVLTLLLFGAGLFFFFRKNQWQDPNRLYDAPSSSKPTRPAPAAPTAPRRESPAPKKNKPGAKK